jgi:hypothetical protein
MPGTYSGYSGVVSDTSSLPSSALWHQVDADLEKRGLWTEAWENFDHVPIAAEPTTTADYGTMRLFSDSGATFLQKDDEGSIFSIVEATSNEGLSIAQLHQPFKIIQGAGTLVYEARVKVASITVASNLFVGMLDSTAMTAIIPITAGGVTSDNNMVGFFGGEADILGEVATTYTADGVTMVEVKADAFTMVADTWIKMGMVFNRKNDNLLEFFVNGNVLPDTKAIPAAAGTDFPNDVRLGWCIATLGGAGAVDTDIDWIRVAQKRVTT